MRVPKKFQGRDNLEFGVEFKSDGFGTLIAKAKITELKFSRPALGSFFQGLSAASLETDFDAVVKAYDNVLKHYSDSPDALIGYAWIFVNVKDEEKRNPKIAIEYATKAIELSNGMNGRFFDVLAIAYYQDSQLKNAVETIQKAVPLCRGQSAVIARATTYKMELEAKQKKLNDKGEKQ